MDMSSFICRRVADVPPSGIRKFFDIVQEMDDVISLSVGEPDFSTPWHIRESCIYSLEQGVTSYTSNQGTLELREALSEYTRADCGVDYNPIDEILVTTGVSEAIDLAIRAITNPGDEIIVAEPCYVSYAPTVAFAGGIPVSLETKRENDFRLTKEELEEKITPKTKAVIINYPNNPTGAVMGKQDMEDIAEVILKHNILLISDEVYDKLTYDGTHTCAASINGMKDNTILLNGFSKAYAMTGWRVGYAMGNRDIIDAMVKIHQYAMLCAPMMGQVAALDALKNGQAEMEKMVREYNRRRRIIIKGLNDCGLDCFEPKGAFYAFPSIANTGLSGEEFAGRLLKEQNVAVVPGDAFGKSGNGFLRCSYATATDEIVEALERIGTFVGSLK